MSQKIKVFKFGGSSLKNVENIGRVVDILRQHRDQQILIVVSAMGETTNGLEKVVAAHAKGTGQAIALLQDIRAYHQEILLQLVPDQSQEVYALINDLFVEIEWVLDEAPHDNYDYMYDQVVGFGELLSSRIIQAALQQAGLPTTWFDARDVILTDNLYREGWVQWDQTIGRAKQVLTPLLGEPGFLITQGFIGSTSENFTTTLGREGSDYSAAIFSHCLDAASMTVWKDVAGVLNADPKIFDNVIRLDRISYKEAIEMTYYGARVIHLKTVKPLQNKNIPLYIKSYLHPEDPGTAISGDVDVSYPPIIAIEKNQALLQISTLDFSFVAEQHISTLFQHIARFRLQVNTMQNTGLSFVVCFNDIDEKVDQFVEAISADFQVYVDRGVELITVRHYQKDLLEELVSGKVVLMEERIKDTAQMVVKTVPRLKLKS